MSEEECKVLNDHYVGVDVEILMVIFEVPACPRRVLNHVTNTSILGSVNN